MKASDYELFVFGFSLLEMACIAIIVAVLYYVRHGFILLACMLVMICVLFLVGIEDMLRRLIKRSSK